MSKSDYKIFTKEFDEEINAEKLTSPLVLDQLYAILQKALNEQSAATARLAQKLQRRLMGRQQRDWDFNLEEGVLDTARLTGIITDPLSPLSFKQEADQAFKDTVVTLLLDNSGSMRGQPIKTTAITAAIIGAALERCGIKFEILGYTTRTWKGGRVHDQWVAAGKPENPGRANELRHIIYKSADTPMRRARKNLAAMLQESLLKENIDGEALQWAAARLEKRSEERKIMIVISDGAPLDDETNRNNNSSYLPNHLKEVAAQIERQKRIELIGLGIGHDPKVYYVRAKKLADADHVAEELISQLDDLFDTPDTKGRRHAPRKGLKGPGL
jgi:cobaltochelatase CobT